MPIKPFLSNYRLVISTLSPVHIGCGQDYEPTNYVIEESVLYFFDPAEALTQDPESRNELLEIVKNNKKGIKEIQLFFYSKRETAIPRLRGRALAGKGVEKFYNARIKAQK